MILMKFPFVVPCVLMYAANYSIKYVRLTWDGVSIYIQIIDVSPDDSSELSVPVGSLAGWPAVVAWDLVDAVSILVTRICLCATILLQRTCVSIDAGHNEPDVPDIF